MTTPRNDSELTKLFNCLLLESKEEDLKDTAYFVLNRITPNKFFANRKYLYAKEIIDILDQMKITIFMLSNIDDLMKIDQNRWNEVHIIPYYQGIFLSLTHRIKEKLFNLVNLLLINSPPSNEANKIKLEKLKKLALEKNSHLPDLLQYWSDEDKGPIGITLKKRTNYQHYIDKLPLNNNLLDQKSSYLLNKPEFNSIISPEILKDIKIKSSTNKTLLTNEAIQKITTTFEEITKNIENIAKILMEIKNFKHNPKKIIEILDKKRERKERLTIKKKVTPSVKTNELQKIIQKEFDNLQTFDKNAKIYSAYLVGSFAREDYDQRFSDINLYVITNNYTATSLSNFNFPSGLNIEVFTKNEFQSKNKVSLKAQFICHYDGIHIYGNELINITEFPMPGLRLTALLNFDIFDKIETFKTWLENNPNPKKSEISQMSKKVIKTFIDGYFSIAMTNDPYYSTNRLERIKHIEINTSNTKTVQLFRETLLLSHCESIDELKHVIELLDSFANNQIRKLLEEDEKFTNQKPKFEL